MAQTITLQPGESVTIVAAGATGPTPVPTPMYYGYFGCDTPQINATADHVNIVMCADWAYHQWGYQAVVDQMTQDWLPNAKARGLKAMIGCNFLLTDQQNNFLGNFQRVTQFRQTLQAKGLEDMVQSLYPFDEPDMNPKLNDALLRQMLTGLRVAWPLPLAVAYGDHALEQGKWYAKDAYDWVGITQYSKNPLANQPSINANQMRILVPGGADGEGSGWRVNPAPWVQYAQVPANRVAMMMPFLWVNYAFQGIGANGMAPLYRGAGKTITGKA